MKAKPLKQSRAKKPPLVEVSGLRKSYLTRKSSFFDAPKRVHALDGISFSIAAGHTVGMVGESGSGKTTAARSILRLIEPDEGRVIVEGQDILSLEKEDLRSFRKKMQVVFQDPFSSLNPRHTIEKILSEPLRIHTRWNRAQIRERLVELMELVGLHTDFLGRYPHEFSGGQRQRIGIARAIALKPSFIILDEPVSALDVSIQGQILNLLSDLQDRLSLTYLFIAHDLAVVEHMCDRIVVMYLGRIVEDSHRQDLYGRPLHPYTKILMKSIPSVKPKKHGFTTIQGEIPSPEAPPAGCHFHPRCPHAMDKCRTSYPETTSHGRSLVACHLYC